jgi:hypothetical protein
MRKFTMYVLICMILSIVSPILILASENTDKETHQINVQFRHIIDVPTDITKDELGELIKIANNTEWRYNELENVFQRFTSYEGLNIEINRQSIVEEAHDCEEVEILDNHKNYTDENGYVTIIASKESELTEIMILDPSTGLEFNKIINLRQGESVIIDLDITSMLSNDANSNSGLDIVPYASPTNPYWEDGELGTPGKRLHCNRFNGPYGNNTYYSSHIKPQAIANFFYSDCDVSINWTLECIKDDIPLMTNFCAAGIPPTQSGSKEASCSGVQGKSRYFHYN